MHCQCLPEELVVVILRSLDAPSIARAACTCRAFWCPRLDVVLAAVRQRFPFADRCGVLVLRVYVDDRAAAAAFSCPKGQLGNCAHVVENKATRPKLRLTKLRLNATTALEWMYHIERLYDWTESDCAAPGGPGISKRHTKAIMFCTGIDLSVLEYKQPTNNRSGGKVVNVSTVPGSSDFKDKIRFPMSESDEENLQTAVWGLSTPMQGQDASRRTLELTVESPELNKFLETLDEKNIQTAVDKSQEWFKKTMTKDAVDPMYVRMLKPPNKPGAKPTVRVKVKCADYPTNIYIVTDVAEGNLTYQRGSFEDLTRNVTCLVIAETVGLWFMSRRFGMSLTATEILVWPNRRSTDAPQSSPKGHRLPAHSLSHSLPQLSDVSYTGVSCSLPLMFSKEGGESLSRLSPCSGTMHPCLG